jgi:hypothetical protein
MKYAVFLDARPCGSCYKQRFGGTYHLHHQNGKNQRTGNNISSVLLLLVAANFFLRLLILVSLMMKAIRSSESSVLIIARRHIPEGGIPENYIFPIQN